MKQYTIREYMGFTRNGPPRAGMISLPEHAFDQLEQFILSNREESSGTQPLELMSLSARPGVGKVITAKNYVGVITTKDGTEIEILPKLTLARDNSDQAVRKVFLSMLRTVQEAPFKTFRTAHLNTSRMRLLDLFVRMFLDETHRLIQRGLKSDYTTKQDNETCVRGKIVFSEHIRKNLLHRERVFVEYDVFSVDCPENRLVKSTALYLQRHTTDLQNRRDLRIVLSVMEQVPNMWSRTSCAAGNPVPWQTTSGFWNCAGCFCRGRVLPLFPAGRPPWPFFSPWSACLKAMWRQSCGKIWTPGNIVFMCRQKVNISLNCPKNSLLCGRIWSLKI